MKCCSIAVVGVLTSAFAFAESRTVATSAEFVQALTDLNGNKANEIVLAAGKSYDVGAYEMASGYHLKFSKLTVRGESDDPRSVVIYGNFTKGLVSAGDGCFVRNVTLSNACTASGSPFSGNWSYTASCSNVVFTCNQGVNGGAATLVYCRDCLFVGNTATASGGAALNLNGAGCTFIGNNAQRGGAISSNQNNNEVIDSLFESNSATYEMPTYGGGAVCNLTGGSYYNLRNCIFCNNRSASTGGAVRSGRMSHCIVSNNVAATCGGGVRSSIVESCDIVFNRACNDSANISSDYYAQGGGVYDTIATDCLIAGNAVYRTQPGVSVIGGGVSGASVLTNCVVRDNF